LNRHLNCGILSAYLDSFTDWLGGQGYPIDSIWRHASRVSHFSRYLKGFSSAKLYEINDYVDDVLYHHLPECKCTGWSPTDNSKAVLYSINRFKKYLSDCHGIDFTVETVAYTEIYQEHLRWLVEKKFLDKGTITPRSCCLKQFLNWYGNKSSAKYLHKLSARDVEAFYTEGIGRCSKSYKRTYQAALRSFFDFCFEQGYTLHNLRSALPTVRTYQLSSIPRKIEESEAKRLLHSVNRTSAYGKRNYAILQILYTYGVRGGQVRALKLEDVDWHKEELYFAPFKGGKSCRFPLTVEVGNALVDYIKNARGVSEHRYLFLTVIAPISPLKISSLTQLIRTEMLKANIQSPKLGSHCFRHCFVSRMIKQGESFKNIADLIGHRAIQSTFIYTKIDFGSLGEVGLELPEVQDENN
jgi:site-specific recombinase XerD